MTNMILTYLTEHGPSIGRDMLVHFGRNTQCGQRFFGPLMRQGEIVSDKIICPKTGRSLTRYRLTTDQEKYEQIILRNIAVDGMAPKFLPNEFKMHDPFGRTTA